MTHPALASKAAAVPRRPRRNTHRTRPRAERRAPTPPDDHEAPAPPQARDVRVDLAGHTVRLADLRARPERYRVWFARARRAPGHARCLCSRTGERLVIREVAGRFHVARWPSTGDNHRPGCPFFTVESRHSGAAGERAAITVTEHGTRIAVDYTFAADVCEPHAAGVPGDGDTEDVPGSDDELLGAGGGPRRATMTGLGLLHWLWESSGLSTWPGAIPASAPGDTVPAPASRGRRTRDWCEVHAALLPTLAQLRLGAQPAPTLLHVAAPYRPAHPDPAREARLAEFLQPLEQPEPTTNRGGPRRGRTRLRRHRRLLLAETKDLTDTEHGHKLALRHFPRPVFLTTEQRAHLQRRFPAAFSSRPGPDARRIVLALVEGSPHGYLRLVDAALMLSSGGYIPAESSFELTMAEQLVAAGREFTKPLRYGGDAVFPDFVLTDTEPATVVEVFGITGREDYEARKQAKLEHYARAAVPIITWDVTDPPPSLARPRPQQ